MRSKIVAGLFVVAFSFCCAISAHAYYVVDTGEGTNLNGGYGWSLDNSNPQWLAGKFSLNQAYSINSVEGWIGIVTDAGTGRISIYGDAGQIPDAADLKFSQDFLVDLAQPSWQGISGLDWDLAAGSYWVAFEDPIGSSLSYR
jgi:hypothetical protein